MSSVGSCCRFERRFATAKRRFTRTSTAQTRDFSGARHGSGWDIRTGRSGRAAARSGAHSIAASAMSEEKTATRFDSSVAERAAGYDLTRLSGEHREREKGQR